MVLLFRGLIGSRMYGLAHDNSDYDYYEIWSESSFARNKTLQTIDGVNDVTQVSLNHFLLLAMNGSHQALDAMFTPYAETDHITALRSGFFAGFNVLVDFERIITELANQNLPKKRLHAARISYNMKALAETGRYNPVLSDSVKEDVRRLSALSDEQFRAELNELNPYITI